MVTSSGGGSGVHLLQMTIASGVVTMVTSGTTSAQETKKCLQMESHVSAPPPPPRLATPLSVAREGVVFCTGGGVSEYQL